MEATQMEPPSQATVASPVLEAYRDKRDFDVTPEPAPSEYVPLTGYVAALVAERPEAIPQVVVRHGDEERSRGRECVVPTGATHERGVDGQVDDVSRQADGRELRELHPVRGPP